MFSPATIAGRYLTSIVFGVGLLHRQISKNQPPAK